MLKPHTFRKAITFTESEWLPIYHAAKQQRLDLVAFIKTAAVVVTASKQAVNP